MANLAAVVGIGQTKYTTKREDVSIAGLVREAAVRALEEGLSGVMVALAFPNVNYVSLEEVAGRMKAVPPDSDTLQTGRDLGVCFGD